jgi:hypothetical protein
MQVVLALAALAAVMRGVDARLAVEDHRRLGLVADECRSLMQVLAPAAMQGPRWGLGLMVGNPAKPVGNRNRRG